MLTFKIYVSVFVSKRLVTLMNMKEKIIQMGMANDGLITSKKITEHGLSRKALSELVASKMVSKIERGIYGIDSGCIDEYYLLQYRFTQGVFSHETALYLLGYSDRIPIEIQMTFPYGYNTSIVKENGIKPIITRNNFDLGIVDLNRSAGMKIRIYEIERTLVDLMKPKYDVDLEQFIPAIKKYTLSSKKDINKLFRYARIVGVEEEIRKYIGVLL